VAHSETVPAALAHLFHRTAHLHAARSHDNTHDEPPLKRQQSDLNRTKVAQLLLQKSSFVTESRSNPLYFLTILATDVRKTTDRKALLLYYYCFSTLPL